MEYELGRKLDILEAKIDMLLEKIRPELLEKKERKDGNRTAV